MFRLHDRLAADTVEICRLPLCRVQLMDDQRFPWLLAVPAREGVTEIHQLWDEDLQKLMQEIAALSRLMQELLEPDKINVGSLGNLVPQLHIHIVGRFRSDAAWPGPIWGVGERVPYEKAALQHRISGFRAGLENTGLVVEGGGV